MIKRFLKNAGILSSGIFLILSLSSLNTQPSVKIALLKYSGGGDWYANPTSLPNLIRFCNSELNMNIHQEYVAVEPGNFEIFNYPFIHMTGHGNVVFDNAECLNLRKYLLAGGFLHIDDNYGLDQYIRREMKKVFPDKDFIELGFDHPIYHQVYSFPKGLPKVHEHDNKPSQGFGIIHEGRLLCFYSFETDLGDGWENPAVHNNSPETRLKALKMGANLITYAFNRGL